MLTTYWFLAINSLIYISANKVVKKKEKKEKKKKEKKKKRKSTQYSNNLITDRSEDVYAVWIIIKGFRG